MANKTISINESMDLATPHQVIGCGKLETFDMFMLRRVWLFVVIVYVIAGEEVFG